MERVNANDRYAVCYHYKPQPILTLPDKGEQGYAAAAPAKYFYRVPLEGYDDYDTVNITAHALPGYTFTHWEGDIGDANETDTTINIAMDRFKTIIPVFEGNGCCEGECEGEGEGEPEEGEQ